MKPQIIKERKSDDAKGEIAAVKSLSRNRGTGCEAEGERELPEEPGSSFRRDAEDRSTEGGRGSVRGLHGLSVRLPYGFLIEIGS